MLLHVSFETEDYAEEYTVEDNESPFYKAIGERLSGLSVPNTIRIRVSEYPDALLRYEVSERGSYKKQGVSYPSMYLIEIADTVYEKLEPFYEYAHVFLTCVNPESNNYKYYEIIPSGEDFFTVSYGRMNEDLLSFTPSGRTTPEPYESRMYWIRYYEKLTKGYVDNSAIYLRSKNNKTLRRKKEPADKHTNESPENKLYAELLSYSRAIVTDNLLVTKIMQAQLDRCNELYYALCETRNLVAFNEKLQELYSICPRRMKNVADCMAGTPGRRKEILEREQRILSSMNAVFGEAQEEAAEPLANNPFEEMDIELYCASFAQREHVLAHLYDELKPKVKNIYRVISRRQKERFDAYLAARNISTVKELWHGSRNENWLSILEKGLLLYPDAVITGKMFGDGIYFASDIYKSLNFTSMRGNGSAKGFMGLFATAYGEALYVDAPHAYSEAELTAQNKNCIHAKAGSYLRNDEIVFYNEAAVLLNYIVEFEKED